MYLPNFPIPPHRLSRQFSSLCSFFTMSSVSSLSPPILTRSRIYMLNVTQSIILYNVSERYHLFQNIIISLYITLSRFNYVFLFIDFQNRDLCLFFLSFYDVVTKFCLMSRVFLRNSICENLNYLTDQ